MAKFKVGDRVYLTKPIKRHNRDALEWHPNMNVFLGNILTVIGVDLDDNTYSCKFEDTYRWCCESWLTKAEELPTKQPTEKVESSDISLTETTKEIDWEQRRWELSSKFYLSSDISTPEAAIKYADTFIEHYKQKIKLK